MHFQFQCLSRSNSSSQLLEAPWLAERKFFCSKYTLKVYGHNDYAIYYRTYLYWYANLDGQNAKNTVIGKNLIAIIEKYTVKKIIWRPFTLSSSFFAQDQLLSDKTVYFMLDSNNRLFLK